MFNLKGSRSSIDQPGPAALKFLTSEVWLLMRMADSTTVILLVQVTPATVGTSYEGATIESLEAMRAGREPDTSSYCATWSFAAARPGYARWLSRVSVTSQDEAGSRTAAPAARCSI
ncbi:hypothetical protein JB92DRAFT_2827620 [Gautieria morchelliformis]|nr:hypothetical protein JB92DRAFT_2827620 [Gautieria morchelliformis]